MWGGGGQPSVPTVLKIFKKKYKQSKQKKTNPNKDDNYDVSLSLYNKKQQMKETRLILS